MTNTPYCHYQFTSVVEIKLFSRNHLSLANASYNVMNFATFTTITNAHKAFIIAGEIVKPQSIKRSNFTAYRRQLKKWHIFSLGLWSAVCWLVIPV